MLIAIYLSFRGSEVPIRDLLYGRTAKVASTTDGWPVVAQNTHGSCPKLDLCRPNYAGQLPNFLPIWVVQPHLQGCDLVGDIHGHADAPHRLLLALDYVEIGGVLF